MGKKSLSLSTDAIVRGRLKMGVFRGRIKTFGTNKEVDSIGLFFPLFFHEMFTQQQLYYVLLLPARRNK